jgi:hypothetical protein
MDAMPRPGTRGILTMRPCPGPLVALLRGGPDAPLPASHLAGAAQKPRIRLDRRATDSGEDVLAERFREVLAPHGALARLLGSVRTFLLDLVGGVADLLDCELAALDGAREHTVRIERWIGELVRGQRRTGAYETNQLVVVHSVLRFESTSASFRSARMGSTLSNGSAMSNRWAGWNDHDPDLSGPRAVLSKCPAAGRCGPLHLPTASGGSARWP